MCNRRRIRNPITFSPLDRLDPNYFVIQVRMRVASVHGPGKAYIMLGASPLLLEVDPAPPPPATVMGWVSDASAFQNTMLFPAFGGTPKALRVGGPFVTLLLVRGKTSLSVFDGGVLAVEWPVLPPITPLPAGYTADLGVFMDGVGGGIDVEWSHLRLVTGWEAQTLGQKPSVPVMG